MSPRAWCAGGSSTWTHNSGKSACQCQPEHIVSSSSLYFSTRIWGNRCQPAAAPPLSHERTPFPMGIWGDRLKWRCGKPVCHHCYNRYLLARPTGLPRDPPARRCNSKGLRGNEHPANGLADRPSKVHKTPWPLDGSAVTISDGEFPWLYGSAVQRHTKSTVSPLHSRVGRLATLNALQHVVPGQGGVPPGVDE